MKTVSSLAVLTAGTVLLCLTTPHVAKAAPPADTYIRTDTELLTKGQVGPNGKTLDDFNLIVFASTTGELDLTDQQKKDILAFVNDDGKGFVGIHAALD